MQRFCSLAFCTLWWYDLTLEGNGGDLLLDKYSFCPNDLPEPFNDSCTCFLQGHWGKTIWMPPITLFFFNLSTNGTHARFSLKRPCIPCLGLSDALQLVSDIIWEHFWLFFHFMKDKHWFGQARKQADQIKDFSDDFPKISRWGEGSLFHLQSSVGVGSGCFGMWISGMIFAKVRKRVGFPTGVHCPQLCPECPWNCCCPRRKECKVSIESTLQLHCRSLQYLQQ